MANQAWEEIRAWAAGQDQEARRVVKAQVRQDQWAGAEHRAWVVAEHRAWAEAVVGQAAGLAAASEVKVQKSGVVGGGMRVPPRCFGFISIILRLLQRAIPLASCGITSIDSAFGSKPRSRLPDH